MASQPVIALPAGWPARSLADARAELTAPGARFEMETITIRGVPTRVWKNAPPHIRFLVEFSKTHGERVMSVYEDERVTYAANFRAVATLANRLAALDVGKGDRVALAMRNLPEWPVAFFAATAIGAIMVPLNAWWTGSELEYGLRDSGAKVLILDDERHQRLLPHYVALPELQHILVGRASGAARWQSHAPGRRDRHTARFRHATRGDAAAGRAGARRRRDDLLHQRHHRCAEGSARHPPQPDDQHHVRRLRRRTLVPAPRRAAARAEPAHDADGDPAVPRPPPARPG